MAGFYASGDYDVAGFAVGIVDRKNLITGEKITAGDVILGLPSTGIHSNGYSLVRRIISDNHLNLKETYEGLTNLSEKSYLRRQSFTRNLSFPY